MLTTIAVASPAITAVSPAIGIRDKILAVISNRDFVVVTIFSTAGLLLTILFFYCVILCFPGLGISIELYNQLALLS
jgi:hypothetical protein